MRVAPLAGRRAGRGPERRTAVDDAEAIQPRVDVSAPRAEKLVLMQDNLHPHTLAALDEAFPPEEARRLLDTLEVHSTPKHGSWRTMAEIDWGVWRGQGLDRRIPDCPTFTSEVTAWQRARHAAQVQVDGPFTTADARVNLKRLDPILNPVNNKWTSH
jgi:DDE superfamily endonuclease